MMDNFCITCIDVGNEALILGGGIVAAPYASIQGPIISLARNSDLLYNGRIVPGRLKPQRLGIGRIIFLY